MNPVTSKWAGRAWFVVAVVAFLAAVCSVVVAALRISDPFNSWDDLPLLIFVVVGIISFAGWWRDRRRASESEDIRRDRDQFEAQLQDSEATLQEARGKLESLREDEAEQRQAREQLEATLAEREEALSRERHLRSRAEEARQAERNWRGELHAEIMQLSRERGALGNPGDVPSMVLRLARTLVGAEKGLLLSRDDGDGRLELVASEGFEYDPDGSVLARRFADDVLERDQTIREEKPGDEVEDGEGVRADEEINNLVAIPIYMQDDFSGVVVCANSPDGFAEYDEDVLLSVGDQAGAVLQNAKLQGELRASYLATVSVLADAIEAKDPLLRGHSDDVSRYVAAVVERLDLPPKRREELIFGSLLHDVGKIGISERILLKPAALTPEERAVIELHPRIGYRLVEQVPTLRSVAPAVLHHHERHDGNGYPSGLSGEEIPLEARVICVADSFSAMISERPYRERMTPDEACEELERHAGTQFDPEVVRIFVEEVRRNPPSHDRKAEPADPELEVRLESDEPVLGHGPLAAVDNLTMLYTRRHLHEVADAEAHRAKVQNRPFGVVLVQLTELEELNKTGGYAAGDEAIQTVARVVQSAAARTGGTAGRHGGSRLGLIVPAANERATERLAEEITADLQDASVRAATAAWRLNDTGDSVIDRAREKLG